MIRESTYPTVIDNLRARWVSLTDRSLSLLAQSYLLPATARKWALIAAGASVASPPGPGLTLSGNARNLALGPDIYMNQRVTIDAAGRVTIGAGCAIGMEVLIITSTDALDPGEYRSTHGSARDVSIGERVWLGARAIVLPGAVIESDVIVAAGAVVEGPCQAHGVYAGVPARRIRDFPRSETAAARHPS